MMNEEIRKKFEFDLEISFFEKTPYTLGTLYCFSCRDEKLLNILLDILNSMKFNEDDISEGKRILSNVHGISINLTAKKFWFFMRITDEDDEDVFYNTLPEYIKDYVLL